MMPAGLPSSHCPVDGWADGRTVGPSPSSATYLIYLCVILHRTVVPYAARLCHCGHAAPRVTRLPVLKVEV